MTVWRTLTTDRKKLQGPSAEKPNDFNATGQLAKQRKPVSRLASATAGAEDQGRDGTAHTVGGFDWPPAQT